MPALPPGSMISAETLHPPRMRHTALLTSNKLEMCRGIAIPFAQATLPPYADAGEARKAAGRNSHDFIP